MVQKILQKGQKSHEGTVFHIFNRLQPTNESFSPQDWKRQQQVEQSIMNKGHSFHTYRCNTTTWSGKVLNEVARERELVDNMNRREFN